MMGGTESRLGKVGLALLIALGVGCRGSTMEVGTEQGGAGGQANAPSATGGAAGAGELGDGTTAGTGTTTVDPDQVDPPPGVTQTDKIDLLFVVDNSASMQDKQVLLARTVPTMLRQIINPPCIDEDGAIVAEVDSPNAVCPEGSFRTHIPVKDMHIGVVSSSLGGHGNPAFCEGEPEAND